MNQTQFLTIVIRLFDWSELGDIADELANNPNADIIVLSERMDRALDNIKQQNPGFEKIL